MQKFLLLPWRESGGRGCGEGLFSVVSNRGEYNLPFVVTVEHGVLNSSIGTIRNLFHFANLAKSNWAEAVRLFYDPDFRRLFQGNDEHFMAAIVCCPPMRAMSRTWRNF